jgi:hypothetical protein
MLLVVEQRAAKRPLGALAASDLELCRREQLPPLVVRLDDASRRDGADQLPFVVEDLDTDGG